MCSLSDCRQFKVFEFAYSLFSFKINIGRFPLRVDAFRGRGRAASLAALSPGSRLSRFSRRSRHPPLQST